MPTEQDPETSLLLKLQRVAEGEKVELTKEEAIIYGVDVADVLPDEDLEESEV